MIARTSHKINIILYAKLKFVNFMDANCEKTFKTLYKKQKWTSKIASHLLEPKY